MTTEPVSSSFRDPAGFVLSEDADVLRVTGKAGAEAYAAAENSGLMQALQDKGYIPETIRTELAPEDFGGERGGCVLRQKKLPFISYPYEWTFGALQDAALRHLDIQLLCLKYHFELSDATAFNVQFVGTRPVFIDIGSFIPRKPLGYWRGYRQFCEQFLNPLLMQSEVGVPFNDFYRGHVRGIPTVALAPMLRGLSRLKPKNYLHVILHAKMIAAAGEAGTDTGKQNMSDEKLAYFLETLRSWIAGLKPKHAPTIWSDYTGNRSYTAQEVDHKFRFLRAWTERWQPDFVLDLGTNTGEAALMAAGLGVKTVVGLEFDPLAANLAYARAKKTGAGICPLVMDLTNMSPSQGWHGNEWSALTARSHADLVYSLAVLHHLVISDGIPMDRVIADICRLGRRGVIEFVPESDPMVISLRARIKNYAQIYSEAAFLRALEKHATIKETETVTQSGRRLFAYEVK